MNKEKRVGRRQVLSQGIRALFGTALVGTTAAVVGQSKNTATVWQIDPDRCVQCEKCATHCVLSPSAVKCVHAYELCGYCVLCGGYHAPGIKVADTAAENQLCPTNAIVRTFIEQPFYEYTIVEEKCIGCAKCVKGCAAFGNGSLFLQVRHDRCQNCHECSVAVVCPSGAFRKVSADQPYILRSRQDG